MQLNLERPDYLFFLRGADAHSALVNERRLSASFLVSPRELIEDWPVASAAALDADALAPLLDWAPEVVLLGTGARQVFPPAVAMAACLRRGIGMEVMANNAAARTYAVLAGEGRKVAAAFILEPPGDGLP